MGGQLLASKAASPTPNSCSGARSPGMPPVFLHKLLQEDWGRLEHAGKQV